MKYCIVGAGEDPDALVTFIQAAKQHPSVYVLDPIFFLDEELDYSAMDVKCGEDLNDNSPETLIVVNHIFKAGFEDGAGLAVGFDRFSVQPTWLAIKLQPMEDMEYESLRAELDSTFIHFAGLMAREEGQTMKQFVDQCVDYYGTK
jgi:hypothetical protein